MYQNKDVFKNHADFRTISKIISASFHFMNKNNTDFGMKDLFLFQKSSYFKSTICLCLYPMWVLIWAFCFAEYWQWGHLKGFSPVWIIICLLAFRLVWKIIKQCWQANWFGPKRIGLLCKQWNYSQFKINQISIYSVCGIFPGDSSSEVFDLQNNHKDDN